MDLSSSVAFITGANRGIGRHFATQLLERGAKVYAGVRNPAAFDLTGAIAVEMDVTDPAAVQRAASTAGDVTLLINNAGILTQTSLLTGTMDEIRAEMESNYFAQLAVIRAFVPVIEANGGGAILDVLSAMSWYHTVSEGAYGAAKAASWAAADSLRQELEPRGITLTTLLMGWMFTDLAAFVPDELKSDPGPIAKAGLDGVAAGDKEVLADGHAKQAKALLSA
ncbi:SDR family oxidoreductase [Actinoplanes sp. TBRC 11911]|uniref:SDR family oxidoreductase n=1 Tax=Actinoplanes sp. TBRC 11911 TaxID=2729386 RepID=UPI00145ED8F3|nr:SDR family oxidoreductase [Actinoplanes sp. TBRC 11911]NMO52849.1 SDR family oxidoreductase [Actinoplanes sp. TBRC 11911]